MKKKALFKSEGIITEISRQLLTDVVTMKITVRLYRKEGLFQPDFLVGQHCKIKVMEDETNVSK